MLSQLLFRLKRVFGLPMILVILHAILMLWVGFLLYQAVGEYGVGAGPKGNLAYDLARFFDFPIFWLCNWVIHTALTSESHEVVLILEWILGDNGFGTFEIRLFLPLLLLLGSVQWFLIGLGVRWIKGFIYKRDNRIVDRPEKITE